MKKQFDLLLLIAVACCVAACVGCNSSGKIRPPQANEAEKAVINRIHELVERKLREPVVVVRTPDQGMGYYWNSTWFEWQDRVMGGKLVAAFYDRNRIYMKRFDQAGNPTGLKRFADLYLHESLHAEINPNTGYLYVHDSDMSKRDTVERKMVIPILREEGLLD